MWEVNSIIAKSIWLIFLAITLHALFSIPKLSLELAMGKTSLGTFAGLFNVGCCFLIVQQLQTHLATRIHSIAQMLTRIPKNLWLVSCLLLGVLLRLVWVFIFPAPLRSDHATYYLLATNLAEHGTYHLSKNAAYWPPGYPLFLSVLFQAWGVHKWILTFVNLLLFCGSVVVVYHLTKMIAAEQEHVARLSTFLLALWPTYLASIGLASKEMILVLFVPLLLLIRFSVAQSSGQWKALGDVSTGIILGAASLTQPSLLLFIGVIGFYEIIRSKSLFSLARLTVFMLLGMSVVILPWTIRNYRTFERFVLISTNGGENFYRANNPLATGGYTERGERSLDDFGEIEKDKLGYQWGKEWIKNNPIDFLRLAVRKQILFLGDDSTGIYETLKRGLEIEDRRYLILKGVAQGYWLGVWVLILIGLQYHRNSLILRSPETVGLIVSVLYFFVLHSIFESGGRYHLPLVGVFCILASLISYRSQHEVGEVMHEARFSNR